MGDAFNRVIAIAHDAIYKDNSIIVYTKNSENPKLAEVAFNSETDCRAVKVGWSTKPKWG